MRTNIYIYIYPYDIVCVYILCYKQIISRLDPTRVTRTIYGRINRDEFVDFLEVKKDSFSLGLCLSDSSHFIISAADSSTAKPVEIKK